METLRIERPRHGEVLGRHDGIETQEGLAIEIQGRCRPGTEVTVNGEPAQTDGDTFRAGVVLRDKRTTLEVRAGEERQEQTLLYDRRSFPRYRLGVDDNIWFLHEIASDPSHYRSFFHHWYPGFFQSLHRDFGARIHLNLYFEHPDEGFDLTLFPDQYRGEIEENLHWLSFSFHARSDRCYQNRIYRDADYETARRDHRQLTREARRIFGRAYKPEFTTIHWAETSREAARGFYDEGVRGLVGRFGFDPRGNPWSTRLYLDEETNAHLHKRNLWYDPDMDLLFVNTPQFLNNLPIEEVRPHYDRLLRGTGERPAWDVIEMLVHEEQFWRGFHGYRADNMERCRIAMQWAVENGLQPAFFRDGLAGNDRE